jgi:tRNA dimethylallyltransferase
LVGWQVRRESAWSGTAATMAHLSFETNNVAQIEEIRSRGRLPILVGGTHYYTQSLLFQDALADDVLLEGDGKKEQFPILDEPTEIILEKLREVDPVMAERWHPNERRKIQRSLEIYLRTGKPASQIYDAQRRRREGETVTNDPDSTEIADRTGLHFPTLVLWVHAHKDVLYPRLEGRIIKMLDKGLLEEVEMLNKFRVSYEERTGSTIDQSRGIWMSIGYKEFLTYQSARSDAQSTEADIEKYDLKAGTEKAQAATRQYANRQLKWIRIKLLNALFGASQKGNTFLLDGSDLSKWEEQVLQPARHITEQFLSGQALPEPTELSPLASEMLEPKRDYDLGQRPDLWQKKVCETCGTVVVTENDWKLHVNSRAHRRAVGMKKKQNSLLQRHERGMKMVQADLVDVLEAYQHTFDEESQG